MGLGGGGGGGILGVGNAFTGPSLGIELQNDHAYAYSGNVTTVGTGSANTLTAQFTTGNYYFVGSISAQNDTTDDSIAYLAMTLNGSSIIDMKLRTTTLNDVTADFPIPIIIPPYTEVELKVGINSGSNTWTTQITGRIYRG